MNRWGAIALLALSGATHAAVFTVTNLNDDGAGSLRDAVVQANAAPGADTVNFSVTGVITLTTGQIRIEDALTIAGPGAALLTIDGNLASRIFTTFPAVSPACPATTGSDFLVALSGMTLRNASRNVVDSSGGAINTGHSLALNAVVVRDSSAKNGGGLAFHGQFAGQSLTIVDSQFIDNRARETIVGHTGSYNGGAVRVSDNCPDARIATSVSIARSVFQGNRVQPAALEGRGGAIANYGWGSFVISDTRIVDNHVEIPTPRGPGFSYPGGGIHSDGRTVTIERSEIAGNSADYGGGLSFANGFTDLQAPASALEVALVNTTVSGNIANISGGAINLFANVRAEVINSTVAMNSADPIRTGGIRSTTGGVGLSSPTLELVSSIVAKNTNVDCGATPILPIVATNSIVRVQNTAQCSYTGNGNLYNQDPLLSSLAFNGGPTRTHALGADSPAIDTGINPVPLATDQRGTGFPRVLGPAADIGAFESPALCAGFSDVAPADAFCPNVKWLKNRDVTLGCVAGQYCPTTSVSRLAMAAFMNRLGTALTIEPRAMQQAVGALDPGTSPVVCVTADFTTARFPRRAYLDGVLSGIAPADLGLDVDLVRSSDSGVSWQTVVTNVNRGAIRAGTWGNIHVLGHSNTSVGFPHRYGLRVTRSGLPSSATLSDSSCNLRVRIDNRNSATAPLDPAD